MPIQPEAAELPFQPTRRLVQPPVRRVHMVAGSDDRRGVSPPNSTGMRLKSGASRSLENCYQQVDEETLLRVVSEPRKLGETIPQTIHPAPESREAPQR